jgi:D-alanine-D-alanine ligase
VSESSNQAVRRTLGPVADLERHLPADWWKKLFNALYLKTDGDVYENDLNTAAEVSWLVEAAGLGPDDRVLDLCCGQGRHALELARRGFRGVAGLDRSRYLIRLARSRARREGLDVRFHEGDARRFRLPPDSFDCVTILGNSFGYFERVDDDLAVLLSARRVLRSRGVLVLDIADGDWLRTRFEPRSWEWIDQEHFVCRERSLSEDGERLISREVVTHAERGVMADQFYGERLYSAAQLQALLERAGFDGVEIDLGAETHSERNQDLGMMAHRIRATCRAPRRAVAASARASVPIPQVTVLLGDPTLPDEVKRDGQFNPEDHETLARMRSALEELTAYEFNYLDRHELLISRLRRDPPAFVLNLCDEGFRNDPRKELHVPALLELFDVPYSGADPLALGLCYDKALVSAIAQSLEIPVPYETYFDAADSSATIPSVFPALVKPTCGDGSVGITQRAVVSSAEELVERVAALGRLLPGQPLLVQEFLSGPEYSVGVIGNPGLSHNVLPILEVDYSGLQEGLPRILSYESKWDPESPYWSQIRYVESGAGPEIKNPMIDASLTLFQRLGCRDYARFDFRIGSDGVPKLLEVNPNPGWCWDGKLNLMAGYAGVRYSDLLRWILEAAQERVMAERNARPAVGARAVGQLPCEGAVRPALQSPPSP